MTHEILQRRLMRFLWVYEAAVISACLIGGGLIALSQGGSVAMAAPLFLIAVAEMLRVPVSGLATRLGFGGRALSAVVLIAIAVISFEGLSMIFETFLDNRTAAVLHAQRAYDRADDALREKQQVADRAGSALDVAKSKVAALDADIANKERSAPTQPGFSGKTCTGADGRAVTCASDRQARADYSSAQKAHIATLADLRMQRKTAQGELDKAAATLAAVNTSGEAHAAADARQALTDTKTLSPMHKLAASVLGVKVADLSEGQFETVKRWGVLGLSAAFATLSAAVSLVAHAPEHTGEETKLARAIRAYIARRRKKVVAIRQIPGPERIVEVEREVVREVPVRQTIIKHIPVDFRSGRHLALPEREIVANGLNPIVSKLVGEAK
jgi:hypothetical protein